MNISPSTAALVRMLVNLASSLLVAGGFVAVGFNPGQIDAIVATILAAVTLGSTVMGLLAHFKVKASATPTAAIALLMLLALPLAACAGLQERVRTTANFTEDGCRGYLTRAVRAPDDDFANGCRTYLDVKVLVDVSGVITLIPNR